MQKAKGERYKGRIDSISCGGYGFRVGDVPIVHANSHTIKILSHVHKEFV